MAGIPGIDPVYTGHTGSTLTRYRCYPVRSTPGASDPVQVPVGAILSKGGSLVPRLTVKDEDLTVPT